jgi:hypothetical protein
MAMLKGKTQAGIENMRELSGCSSIKIISQKIACIERESSLKPGYVQ